MDKVTYISTMGLACTTAITLLIVSVSSSLTQACPSGLPSTCSCPGTTVDCRSSQLAAIPTNIPRSTEILYLSENKLSVLPSDSFSEFRNLTELSLGHCSIAMLNSGVFNGLQSLQVLNLNGNMITALDRGLFSELQSLLRLHLHNNRLSELQLGVFNDLRSLKYLRLYGNKITVLGPDVLSELRSLRELTLGFNNIATLDQGVFNELRSLRRLYLNNNKITMLNPGVFRDLQNLQMLYLHNNRISGLYPGVFRELVILEILLIHGNDLTTIPEGVFDQFPPGITITFSNNPWYCDCNLRWLQEMLLNTTYISTEYLREDWPLICEAPSFYASELLVDIEPRLFPCPPVIQVEIPLDVTVGTTRFELACPVIEDPDTHIEWVKSDRTGQQMINVQSIHSTHPNGSLTIKILSESDSGIYTCTASNSAGSDQLMYNLNVISLPVGIITTPALISPMDTETATISAALFISIGVLCLFLIVIVILVVIVIKQRRHQLSKRDGNTGGIQGYDEFITNTPEADNNETTDIQEDHRDHYAAIDEDGAVHNPQSQRIPLARLNSTTQPENDSEDVEGYYDDCITEQPEVLQNEATNDQGENDLDITVIDEGHRCTQRST